MNYNEVYNKDPHINYIIVKEFVNKNLEIDVTKLVKSIINNKRAARKLGFKDVAIKDAKKWFVITPYLFEMLEERGETVIDNFGPENWKIWGDSSEWTDDSPVIKSLCCEIGILSGQDNSWAKNKNN